MKQFIKLLTVAAIILILTGCGQKDSPIKETERNTGFAVPAETYSKNETVSMDETDNPPAFSKERQWENRLQYGKLIFTIEAVHVITDQSEIGDGGYGEHSEIAMHNGDFYELAMDNWREYGEAYETVYNYPSYIDESGKFMDGTCMIAVDICVTSQDATNQWLNDSTGTVETRYGNPYLFKADSILYLVDTEVKDQEGNYIAKAPGFFSGYGVYSQHPLAYELEPGETITFRIGFLLGDRPDGTDTDISDLVITPNPFDAAEQRITFNLNYMEGGQ